MKLHQLFITSTILLILANYWFLVSSDPSLPRLFDYIAYGFFLYGLYILYKKENKK